MQTVADLIAEVAARHGERVALQMRRPTRATTPDGSAVGKEQWTYGDVYRHARRCAAFLQQQGLRKGDRIVLWAANQPQWVTVFYGAMLAGCIVVPLDVRSTADFVRKIEERSGASLMVADGSLVRSLTGEHVPTVVIEEIDALLPADDLFVAVDVQPDDYAELVFTSGTTGTPKGVILTHGNILSDAEAALDIIVPQPTFRALSLLPLSHMYEQVITLFYCMMGGACVTFIDSLQPSTIFQTIQEEGITVIACVPQVLALFMQGIEREVRKLGKEKEWRLLHQVAHRLPFALRRYLFPTVHKRLGGKFEFFVSGGAYLDPNLANKWENMGVRVVCAYGMTEAAPFVAANRYHRRDSYSVGWPARCNRVKIAEDGEILVSGTNITPGYWQDSAATEAAFTADGWYRTGDLGLLDSKGRIVFKGRKKNMIVLGNGMNVYPEDVENILAQDPDMIDAVVLGLEEEGDVAVHAVLLTRQPDRAHDIVKAANKQLAPHQRIKHHTVWPDETFPSTHTLKVKRMEVLPRVMAMRAQQRPTPDSVPSTPAQTR